MTLTRIALPLPSCSLTDEADRYVASLDVRISGEKGSVETTGDLLEDLLLSIRLRHLAFSPHPLLTARTMSEEPAWKVRRQYIALCRARSY